MLESEVAGLKSDLSRLTLQQEKAQRDLKEALDVSLKRRARLDTVQNDLNEACATIESRNKSISALGSLGAGFLHRRGCRQLRL